MDETKVYTAIGLMAGTSLDGVIDVALIRTDGRDFVEPQGFYAHPYDRAVRDKVRACFGQRRGNPATQEAEALVTALHIEAVQASGFAGDVIGFHGQTILHNPNQGETVQLGRGDELARATGMDVICDFRSADVKAGGQGAPLIPIYHAALAGACEKPLAVLNLGGVANVTYIGADGTLLAFDTGPANALLDDFTKMRTGADFDEGGALAAQGTPDAKIIERFMADDYFKKPPPKSLDRNQWMMAMVEDLSTEDGAATLMAMSVQSVVAAQKFFPQAPKQWLVCGGGRKNAAMMAALSRALSADVQPIEAIGGNGDAIEAEGFAYLAVRSLLGLPISFPGTTGVAQPMSGGVLHKRPA